MLGNILLRNTHVLIIRHSCRRRSKYDDRGPVDYGSSNSVVLRCIGSIGLLRGIQCIKRIVVIPEAFAIFLGSACAIVFVCLELLLF